MRLIDADQIGWIPAEAVLVDKKTGNETSESVKAEIAVRGLVDEMPTVEAEPVIHAHWMPPSSFNADLTETRTCSHCNKKTVAKTMCDFKYCPHCGAKIDEEE